MINLYCCTSTLSDLPKIVRNFITPFSDLNIHVFVLIIWGLVWFDLRCNATFNNILFLSWRSVLLVEETGENYRPVGSHWQFYPIMLYRVHLALSGVPYLTADDPWNINILLQVHVQHILKGNPLVEWDLNESIVYEEYCTPWR